MAHLASGVAQRVIAILRGPTGGMLACLLTASLLGGVAAAHPAAWSGSTRSDGPTSAGQSTSATSEVSGSSCAVVLLGLESASDPHGVTQAIKSVRANCDGEPQAPGLIVALRHLRQHLENGRETGGGATRPDGRDSVGGSKGPSGDHSGGPGSGDDNPGSIAGGSGDTWGGTTGGGQTGSGTTGSGTTGSGTTGGRATGGGAMGGGQTGGGTTGGGTTGGGATGGGTTGGREAASPPHTSGR
jgi:hypothetical protein